MSFITSMRLSVSKSTFPQDIAEEYRITACHCSANYSLTVYWPVIYWAMFLNWWVTESFRMGHGMFVSLQNFNDFRNCSFYFEKAESVVLMPQSQREKGALGERQRKCMSARYVEKVCKM